MNIYVLVKRTFDTEEKIVVSGGKIQEDGAEFIINPYDEYAIEEAIRVREAHGGEVTVLTMGGEEAEKQLRTALAMGADKAVLINTEDDVEEMDEFAAAYIIAEYLKDKNYIGEEIIGKFRSVTVMENIQQKNEALAKELNLDFANAELQKLFISLTNS